VRILAVHLRNLNSLAGSWSLDFTAPEYAASGIFAITGPTGAGKSTLLDAVCLALFGRTPRLGSISKGSNEIMSRRAGDCFAEVSFSTKSGQYRCHWGQHRARRKPGGELQTPRHEIVDLNSGKVLESRSREVVRMVEQVTGMDYDRFTRSILLAQGDFAAFLEADADQRAPILEQITGTGIYSRLSMAVHERTSEERKKTVALQETLGTLKLLSREEEQEIGAAIAANTATAAHLRRQQEQVENRLQCLGQIAALKIQIGETENGLIRLAEQRKLAEPDLQRLERGQRAQTLAPLQTALSQLQDRIEGLLHKDRQRSECLQTLEHARIQLHTEHARTLEHFHESRSTREREQERIKEVRALDLQLHEKKKAAEQQAAALAQLEREQNTIRQERDKLRQRLVELRGRQEQLHQFFSQHAEDAFLVEQLAGLRQQLLHLSNREDEFLRLQQALIQQRRQQQGASTQQQQLDHAVDQAAQTLNALRQNHHRQQQERDNLLGQQALRDLRIELEQQEARLQQLQRAVDLGQRIHSLQEDRTHREEQGRQLLSRQQQITEQLHHLEERRSLHLQLVAQCEQNHQLSLQIRRYDEERATLAEGQACPLCGSTHHPWKTNQPAVDDSTTPLHQARAALEQSQADIARQREQLAALSRDLEHSAQALTQEIRQIAELEQQLFPLLAAHGLGPLDACGPVLADALEMGQLQATAIRTRLAAIDQVDEKLHTMARQMEQAANLHAEALQRAQANQQILATLEHEISTLETRCQEHQAWLMTSRKELEQTLRPLGLLQVPPQGAQELIKVLEHRLQRWKTHAAQQENLGRQEVELTSTLERQDLHAANLEERLNTQKQDITNVHQQQAILRGQRRELYGELDPNVEEQRLRTLVQQAENHELAARTKLAATEKEHHSLGEQQRLDRQELETLLPKKTSLEAQLLAQVQAAGFVDLATFAAAIVSPETLQQLDRRRQELEQQQALLIARRQEQADALAREESRLDHAKTQMELQTEKEAVQRQIEELLQRVGADRERLQANQRRAQEFEEQRQALANQQQELERWELLHQLIGSADGKKFRVFAQGLTFEVMVSHANRQLRKMSDRYILLRDPVEPLALQVIDNYQAGEIRSTRNLSGGESFLVSLALSLGLSAMSGSIPSFSTKGSVPWTKKPWIPPCRPLPNCSRMAS
jgi:exonuclease SbcC